MTVLGVVAITSIIYLALTCVWVYWLEDYFERQDSVKFGNK